MGHSMNRDLHLEIKAFQRDIEREENKINDFTIKRDNDSVKNSIDKIHADLKYLSIIVNGVPIDPKDSMKIRNFLRIHYENLWRIPLRA